MSNEFLDRHIGPNQTDIDTMLDSIGCASVDEVVSRTVPESILFGNRMEVDEGLSERDTLELATKLAGQNQLFTNFIGQGYYGTLMPSVIQRNILEKSRLVYGLHTLSSRDFSGSFGDVTYFPTK
jgi:Glycine cleavage system protein P (pyridoxal-binding), N-terminal domain